MAVYTAVTDSEIAAYLAAYDLGEMQRATGIAEGVENSNFRIEMIQNGVATPYILTLFEKRVREDELPFFIGLMGHLAARRFPAPMPVAMRDGVVIGRLKDRPAVMVSFLQGSNNAPATPERMRALGEAMAQLHNATADFQMSRENDLSVSGWQRLYDKSKGGLDGIRAGLRDMVEAELAFLTQAWPQDLPAGVIHADLFPDNVFFEGEQLSGVIDFYFACHDAYAYELAICLNCWCFDTNRQFQPAWADAMMEGYQSIRPLSADERDAMPILARGAALRFLLTRAHDWIFHDPQAVVTPKDPLEYAAYLQAHQQQGWRL